MEPPVKFVFVSNYLNHHQIPFCNAMYELLHKDFIFIQTEPMEQERLQMGWKEQGNLPYLKLYYEEPAECRHLIDESRVVFFGGTDDESYISRRLEEEKPVIRYSERLYKTGRWKAISPRGLRKKYHDHTRYRKGAVYMLCAGAYVPTDFRVVRAYPGKMRKWGYFPETKHYDMDELMAGKEKGRILWAGRFLDWKHPELPVKTAAFLKERGHDFHLDMIGGGEQEEQVRRLIEEYGLWDVVTLHGFCPPEKVREMMERSDIYLATSDRMEGWGAVVNEAMNSGCCVVGSHMMGAVPFLIEHEKNGLIYRDGKEKMLFEMTERLLLDRELCKKMGRCAAETILQEWNAEVAAGRLLGLCIRLRFLMEWEVEDGKTWKEFPNTGPCSGASVISEKKMYSYLMDPEKEIRENMEKGSKYGIPVSIPLDIDHSPRV